MYELASYLVRNHLKFLHQHEGNFANIINRDALIDFLPTRVIAIVGAGASSICGLPLAKEGADVLKSLTTMPKEMLDSELEKLTGLYNLPQNTFETLLMALSANNYIANETKINLTQLYKIRYIPNLFYEIIAHFLKHKFIDAIINFNFDELLDQSIEDELDEDEYRYIISDGDCPESISLSNTESWLPLYIKPHGTISHPSSLRYTHEDYFKMPLGIKDLLSNLIYSKYQTIFIIAGFSMQSFEFNKILGNVSKENKIRTYLFNRTDLQLGDYLANKLNKKFISVKDYSLGKTFEKLYEHISKIFGKSYKPRDINRHKLVDMIFQKQNGKDIKKHNDTLKDYYYQRSIIEIYLLAAKCKGIININELAEGKSGKYYDKYRNSVGYDDSMTLFQLCKKLGFHQIGYSREMLKFKTNTEKFDESIIQWKLFNDEIDKNITIIKDLVPSIEKVKGDKATFKYFIETLENMYNSEEVEIKIKPVSYHNRLFKRPKLITTKTEFTFLTRQIFQDSRLKYLWIIAETGEYLVYLAEDIKHGERDISISLIVADSSFISILKAIFDNALVEIYKLSWWQHNRHMTIALDLNREPISSIYFSRRQKGSHISPIFLGTEDTIPIIEIFNQYKDKSKILD